LGTISTTASTRIWASIGEIADVYSRSPALSHYSLADTEWLILPAILNGQFYAVKATSDLTGVHAPIAAVTWAFVSPEVDLLAGGRCLLPMRFPIRFLGSSRPAQSSQTHDFVGVPEGDALIGRDQAHSGSGGTKSLLCFPGDSEPSVPPYKIKRTSLQLVWLGFES
jgi:hypothetical protein